MHTRPSVLLMHPTGNVFVRQTAKALAGAGWLAGLHTSIAWPSKSIVNRLLPGGLAAELNRRSYEAIPDRLVHAHPWKEMVRLLAIRRGWSGLIRHETGRFCMDAVCASLDLQVSRGPARKLEVNAVYAYDDCALQSFRTAREHGAACIYELPIGYLRQWRLIRDEEIQREPLWGRSLSGAIDSEAKLDRKDEEIAAADRVIVPSRFVADSLQGTLAQNVVIVPYGCPAMWQEKPRETRAPGPLRVLYVGSIGQRKGIGYLLRAMEQLRGVAELSLIGRFPHPVPELVAQLSAHRWIPSLPHAKVLEAMRAHDVLVLPTLFEGRTLVVLEALSQGLPVITTLNSGTEDVVRDGISGFIVPIRSPEAIAAAITRLAEDDALLAAMSEAALQIASENSWEVYRQKMLAVIGECCSSLEQQ